MSGTKREERVQADEDKGDEGKGYLQTERKIPVSPDCFCSSMLQECV